ncbi:MAG: hypothetical protein ACJ8M4_10360 [Chthoniobacterales bacterium]
MNSLLQPETPARDGRWRFLRDVVVFQLKMLLDNGRDLVLMPVALVAALIDLLIRGDREGARFYKVLRWGWHSEKVIDVYSAIENHPADDFEIGRDYTVDGVIARLENVVAREVEKGGTAASIKSAMDRAIDQLHAGTGGARDAVVRTADKFREKLSGDVPPGSR